MGAASGKRLQRQQSCVRLKIYVPIMVNTNLWVAMVQVAARLI
jgi:hypothetical protein